MTINLPWDKYLGIFKLVILLRVSWRDSFMVIRVSNKNIHRYKYMKRRIHMKGKAVKKTDKSFGDILANIEQLKADGVISVSNINISIAKTINLINN